jgi:hypothetical protein
MAFANSKLVPAAFWIGFLLLGFITSFSGPDRRAARGLGPAKEGAAAPLHVMHTAKTLPNVATPASRGE